MQHLSLGSAELGDLAAEVLAGGGRLPFKAAGSSMLPTIREGDMLVAEGLGRSPVREGDVILHRTGEGGCAVHRARSIDGSRITMACDARPWSSYIIDADDAIGRIVSARRGGRELDLELGRSGAVLLRIRFLLVLTRNSLVAAAGALVSLLARSRTVRRVYSSLMSPLVRYGRSDGADGKNENYGVSWELFEARVLGRTAGSVQLVRFAPGLALSRYQWLFSMTVARPLRGAGIGRRLTAMVIEAARSNEDQDLCLAVRRDNHRAVALYSSMGFGELNGPIDDAPWDDDTMVMLLAIRTGAFQ